MNKVEFADRLFPQVLQVTQNANLDVKQKSLLLEALADTHGPDFPLNVHRFKVEIDAGKTEQFWKAVQCKAAQPTLFVDRILKSPITKVYEGSKHFKREPLIEGASAPLKEHVYIDQQSLTVLFVAKKSFFSAINRVVEEGGRTYIEGIYFDGMGERENSQFQKSVQGWVEKMKESISTGKVHEHYQKYVVRIGAIDLNVTDLGK